MAANMVSVTSLWIGNVRVRMFLGGSFSAESKSPTIRSGVTPSFRACSYPASAQMIK